MPGAFSVLMALQFSEYGKFYSRLASIWIATNAPSHPIQNTTIKAFYSVLTFQNTLHIKHRRNSQDTLKFGSLIGIRKNFNEKL